jgi:hypothetical protein
MARLKRGTVEYLLLWGQLDGAKGVGYHNLQSRISFPTETSSSLR